VSGDGVGTPRRPAKPVSPEAVLGAAMVAKRTCRFGVWAPKSRSVELRLVHPFEKVVPLNPLGDGYFGAEVENVEPGSRYFFRLDDGKDRPDPASRLQPEGVFGPSEVISNRFEWTDDYWCGIPLQDFAIYELHVGTFTPEGTFDAAAEKLAYLRDLGVNAVEFMPCAAFPGTRNWGYDGVFPFAVQASYGGPDGLRRFVDAAHAKGVAVIMDVVYNHAGPRGGVLGDFGPYFESRYSTPWGPGFNFDAENSDGVRRYFLENALMWIRDYRLDGLRLDAVHMIYDDSARPFLEALGDAVRLHSRSSNRLAYTIAEAMHNDPRLVRQTELGGLGLDSVWNDDFHHALHALLTGERNGYYADHGGVEGLAKAYREGFVLTGNYSRYRKRSFGRSSKSLPGRKMVVYAQNHDQTGNRAGGERLGSVLSSEAQKLATGAMLLSPYLPMLFMGEEYGETVPFHFFTDFDDPELDAIVREGRKREFERFEYSTDFEDPAAPATFEASRLDWSKLERVEHKVRLEFVRELLRLRRDESALRSLDKELIKVEADEKARVLSVVRPGQRSEVAVVMHFADADAEVKAAFPDGNWARILDSSEKRWGGPGELTPEVAGSSGGAPMKMRAKSLAVFRRAAGGA
jgi:maltooligosyltrehalose trehalohydrolase